MTLEEGKRLLEGEGLPFSELYYENENAYWAGSCPWTLTGRGRECPVTVLRIEAPNGVRHLDVVFRDGEFEDLCFGGFDYELWESEKPHTELLDCIRDVMDGKSWCIVTINRRTGRWLGDGLVCAEEEGSLRKKLAKLRRPRTRWERLFRTQRLYEVYDWNEYHRIER